MINVLFILALVALLLKVLYLEDKIRRLEGEIKKLNRTDFNVNMSLPTASYVIPENDLSNRYCNLATSVKNGELKTVNEFLQEGRS